MVVMVLTFVMEPLCVLAKGENFRCRFDRAKELIDESNADAPIAV
jgi:hypothetical protein